jgi:hypothetical protein
VVVVVGSRHDSVARRIVEVMPAALCSAEDLTQPGWVWPLACSEPARWVIGGRVVDDDEVSGVLVRRSCVYPEELVTTHPQDREYLAAESTAFLVFLLSRTRGRVVNPVADGALGDDAVRPERWMPMAADAGLTVAPLRMRSGSEFAVPSGGTAAEVVGNETFGDAPAHLRAAAVKLAAALGMVYATFVFDEDGRLAALSAGRAPSDAAVGALRSVLSVRSGT